MSGLWWSSTAGAHVGFESWLERDELIRLDFDPTVTGIASQPFWLYWTDEDGVRVWPHLTASSGRRTGRRS